MTRTPGQPDSPAGCLIILIALLALLVLALITFGGTP